MSIAFPQVTSTQRSVDATAEPPIQWLSALVGLFFALVVVVGVTWLASPRQAQVARPAVQPEALVVAAPTAVPTPIPPPSIAVAPERPAQLRVTNTNGSGVNLRARAGERGQRLKTVPEGTLLEVTGVAEETADGLTWRQVRDPGGTTGWVAVRFVATVAP